MLHWIYGILKFRCFTPKKIIAVEQIQKHRLLPWWQLSNYIYFNDSLRDAVFCDSLLSLITVLDINNFLPSFLPSCSSLQIFLHLIFFLYFIPYISPALLEQFFFTLLHRPPEHWVGPSFLVCMLLYPSQTFEKKLFLTVCDQSLLSLTLKWFVYHF